MQVASGFTGSCPFLLESDILSLSSDFGVDKRRAILRDHSLGASHGLSDFGVLVASKLQREASLAQLQALGVRHQVTPSHIHEFLGFLNSLGALQRRPRRLTEQIRASGKQLRLLARRLVYPQLAWRREATVSSLIQGVGRVCRPVVAAAGVMGWLIAGTGLASAEQAGRLTLLGLSVFMSSIFIHEWSHWWAIRRSESSVIILQRGLRLGIVHLPLSPLRELGSALAGPVAGLVWCVVWGSVTMVPGLGWLIGGFHILSLLPGYGDGQSLVDAMRNLKSPITHES